MKTLASFPNRLCRIVIRDVGRTLLMPEIFFLRFMITSSTYEEYDVVRPVARTWSCDLCCHGYRAVFNIPSSYENWIHVFFLFVPPCNT
jgi:hypothetical protein